MFCPFRCFSNVNNNKLVARSTCWAGQPRLDVRLGTELECFISVAVGLAVDNSDCPVAVTAAAFLLICKEDHVKASG